MSEHTSLSYGQLRSGAALVAISFREELMARSASIGRAAFLLTLLYIFSNLWRVALADGLVEGITQSDAVWYLLGTEIIVLGLPFVHREMQLDIESGNVGTQLLRPASYMWTMFAQGFGSFLGMALVLGITGFFGAWVISGNLPREPLALTWLLLIVPMSGAVLTLWLVMVGYSSFWITENWPLYWMFQKGMFVLGGIFFPLILYPEWMQIFAQCTPYYSCVFGPGSIFMLGSQADISGLAAQLGLWFLITLVIAAFVDRSAMRRVEINGG